MKKVPAPSTIYIDMMNRVLLLLFMSAVANSRAALAEGVCWKKNTLYNPIPADSRMCRLDQIFSSYLSQSGLKGSEVISTHERVADIGSTLTDSHLFPPVLSAVPSAEIVITYSVPEREDILTMNALLDLRPGYFAPLEAKLAREGQRIVCDTRTLTEDAFLAAGGALNYEIRLAPRFIWSDLRWIFASVQFSISSCEAH